MSANYEPELTDDVSKVRFALGDTDVENPLLSDEEITAKIAEGASILMTSAELADSIAARYARRVSISIDGASFSYGELSRSYSALAQRLRARATNEDGGLGSPVVTGISISDMDAVDANTDRVPSQFKIGQFDNTPRQGGGTIGGGSESDEYS